MGTMGEENPEQIPHILKSTANLESHMFVRLQEEARVTGTTSMQKGLTFTWWDVTVLTTALRWPILYM